MMIRAVFFDFDHTLYSHKTKDIPKSARKAIRILQSKGILCVLATGRHLVELYHFPVAFEVGLDGFVTTEGQLCLDAQKRTICSNQVTGKDLEDLISLFHSGDYHVILEEEDRMYCNFPKESDDSEMTNIRHFVDDYTGNPVYMGVVYVEKDGEPQLSKRIPGFDFIRWGQPGVDVTPTGRDKVSGIRDYLDYYGINEDEFMAFGDGFNDVDMVRKARIGVAMGNAKEPVKTAADYVTTSVDDDGIWNALKHFGLI